MTGTYLTLEGCGIKYLLDTSVETLKILRGVNVSSTTAKSVLDNSTNAVYTVTAGKTFKALYAYFISYDAVGTMAIYQGDSADAITLAKGAVNSGAIASIATLFSQAPLGFTVAATKYITLDNSVNGGFIDFYIIGFES